MNRNSAWGWARTLALHGSGDAVAVRVDDFLVAEPFVEIGQLVVHPDAERLEHRRDRRGAAVAQHTRRDRHELCGGRERAGGATVSSMDIRMNPYEADFIGVRFTGPFTSAPQTVMSAPFCAALAWITGTASLSTRTSSCAGSTASGLTPSSAGPISSSDTTQGQLAAKPARYLTTIADASPAQTLTKPPSAAESAPAISVASRSAYPSVSGAET